MECTTRQYPSLKDKLWPSSCFVFYSKENVRLFFCLFVCLLVKYQKKISTLAFFFKHNSNRIARTSSLFGISNDDWSILYYTILNNRKIFEINRILSVGKKKKKKSIEGRMLFLPERRIWPGKRIKTAAVFRIVGEERRLSLYSNSPTQRYTSDYSFSSIYYTIKSQKTYKNVFHTVFLNKQMWLLSL